MPAEPLENGAKHTSARSAAHRPAMVRARERRTLGQDARIRTSMTSNHV
ncbi:hypothetical protein ACU686_14955 [Yinghuangia aomiensis]